MRSEALSIINSRGLRLSGVLHIPGAAPRETWIILNHGMLSTKDSRKHVALAEALCELGFMVERHDFTGQGESEGDPNLITYSNEVDDLECVMTELQRRGATRFVLIGSSMGSGISMFTAARRPERVAALVLMASITKTGTIYDKMSETQRERWRSTGFFRFGERDIRFEMVEDGRAYDVRGSLARYPGPVLFVHGTRDELISIDDIPGLAASHKGEHTLIPIEGADHRFSEEEHREEITRLIVEWITRRVS